MAYVKLFGSILASTIWRESPETRIVWITMLAMADRDGIVSASVPGLAHMAQVDVADCREALQCLMSPDPDSRTVDYEGRRIAEVEGGWAILNYEAYRDRASMEDKRQKDAERQRRKYHRDAKRHEKPHANLTDLTAASRTLTKPRLSEEEESQSTSEEGPEENAPAPAVAPRVSAVPKPDEVPSQTWADWIATRKAKRAGPVTATVLRAMAREAASAGIPLSEAVQVAAERGWQAFKADWHRDPARNGAAVKKHISRECAMPGFSKDQPKEDWEL